MKLLLALLLSSHAGLLKGRDAPADDPAIVVQARSLAASDRMEAIAVLEEYLAQGADPELLPVVALNAGEQRRLGGDPSSAREHFQRVLKSWPDTDAAQGAKLGLALVAYDTDNASGNTSAQLGLIADEVAPPSMNADRYRLLALEAIDAGEPDSKIQALVENAYVYADDPSVAGRVERSLGHLRPEETPPPDVSETNDAADIAALDKARRALQEGDYASAVEHADALQSTFPDSELLLEAEWVKKKAEVSDPYDALKIGVLLPLSGTYAPPGKQVKQALELAVDRAGGGVQLVFRDTAGDADTAVTAFEELVLDHGCAAVIGPLVGDVSFPVALHAQAAEVPLVTLTQSAAITETGNWVYRGMMTIEHQVDALLDEVMGERGMLQFAVMAPESDYGRLAKEEFLKQVVERGGTVSVVEMYDPDATDFRKNAAMIGRKDYEARRSELYRLRKDAEERGEDPSKVVLPPQMDYDAIFIPDSYTRVALVASALAYEEFPVGNFQPRRGVENIPLLGLSGWHNAELFTRGGLYVQNSVFVDAYTLLDPKSHAFAAEFRDAVGRNPGVLDAVAYDTARLVSVAARTQPADRYGVRSALSGANVSAPVSTGGRFDGDREVVRDLYVMTITRDVGITLVPGSNGSEGPPEPQ
ncbi:MAG: ABC transporter substrate-binding protein [Proteobacteria bacterium]|nr:ABC transporter substrate-binding protein [Pseudomonadota bacterium]MCP4917718.1 ABC transporter substrate-binding protein [Pseudomonadota bacterium]